MKIFGYVKFLPFVAILVAVIFFGANLKNISFEQLVSYSPSSFWLAGLFFLGVYALKSVSVIFPLVAIYLAAGAIFPVPWAIFVNLVGLAVCTTLPYVLGKICGKEAVSTILGRFKKAKQLEELSMQNGVMVSYLLRVVSILPGDVVSMFLGAYGIRYSSYLVGSVLGLAPIMIPATMVGQSITSPFSMKFIIPFLVMIAISLITSLLCNRWMKRGKA
ncbi:TVP38/TMEM64 family protein [Zongyangia hominis]|uniref:TVP38/TMEM64 family membrane protein n=1 Tax=Zongyangia hominis TaxID=2763677 RepID=A0A926EAR2_9FIRM|nr:VTT domain-containing protein [Zongyangia hominis]MBC8571070.1 TVP38/TMEM64 family protein [Zongyangia hominis]